jgi:hypothetical protein
MEVGEPSARTVTRTGVAASGADLAAATAAAQAGDDAAPQGRATVRAEPTKEAGAAGPVVRDRSGAITRTLTLKEALRPSARADVVNHPTSSAHVSRRATIAQA